MLGFLLPSQTDASSIWLKMAANKKKKCSFVTDLSLCDEMQHSFADAEGQREMKKNV